MSGTFLPFSQEADLPPAGSRIVVAMSGGVDSSVVAATLAQTHEVIGITLQLYDSGSMARSCGGKTCCAGQDIYDAKAVARKMDFPHYVFDYESRFQQKVMDDFADTYLRGETPIPCVQCNQDIKFKDLLEAAQSLQAVALATGHYVKRLLNPATGQAELHRAAEKRRDQSYFLFGTTQAQLDYLRFPLGHWTKAQTRAQAAAFGLELADKPDSQDICFVPDGDYASVVKKMRPESLIPGPIMHQDGRLLGQHRGIVHYTIGQRRGLGLDTFGEPLFVLRILPETHTIIVGPHASLAKSRFSIHKTHWFDTIDLDDIQVKLRSSHEPISASIQHTGNDTADVSLAIPTYAISPGQVCAVYQGDRVLGGGWIQRDVL